MNHLYALNNLKQYAVRLFPKRLVNDEALNQADPSTPFQKYRQKVVAKGEKTLDKIRKDLIAGECTQLDASIEQLYSVFDLRALTDEAIKLLGDNTANVNTDCSPVPNYLISSWFLAECHAYLTSQPNGHERLHLVTGIKLSPRERILDHMVKVTLASASVGNALADQHALQKTLIEMDDWGHSLHGLFHSHPWNGVSATKPSPTDFATHRRYESGGYPLIGAIFVKDGFCRFFSNQPFSIAIHGKGVTQHDEHVFKIKI